MTDRDRLRHVAAWLADLASLVAGHQALADAKAKLGAYTTLLADEFPPGAFTRYSLSAVARECKFFPTYGELCGYLSAWWRDHRPMPVALPSPRDDAPRQPPTPAEIEHVRQAVSELVGELRAAETRR